MTFLFAYRLDEMLYGYYGPEEYERLTSTFADPNSFQYSQAPGKCKTSSNPSSILNIKAKQD
jgi:hypothetical protein